MKYAMLDLVNACGGATEEYQYCWDNNPKDYLIALER